MRLNIRTLTQNQGTRPFQGTLNLSGISMRGETPLPEPCEVTGGIKLEHQQLSVWFELRYTLHTVCSRCLDRIVRQQSARFEHIVVEKLRDDSPEDWAEAPEGMLDIEELAHGDMALFLESAPLCREACKGLCPVCGADRNAGDCGCGNTRAIDPRLKALSALIEDKTAQSEGISKGGAEDGSTED